MAQKLINRRSALLGAGAAVAAAVAAFLLTRWSDAEIDQVRKLQAAIFDVQLAIDYVNRRGGALDPEQTAEVLRYYQRAQSNAAAVGDDVLARVHRELPKVWHEIFCVSTDRYVAALAGSNRDGAREAAILQDDWIRWYNLNKRKMTIPAAATSADTSAVAVSTFVAPRKESDD